KGVQKFQTLGGEMPSGMLLAGPPGTGKTFLAGVVAAEANLPFIYIDASSLSSMWMGMDALIVISLWRKARGLARKYATPGQAGACILFLDDLDPALIRPGRLDRRLNVYSPDGDGRKDILQYYLRQKAHDTEIPIDLMVQDSIGWTPIEIKTIINEALIVAHDDGRDFLNYRDWLQARDARQLGIKQPIQTMSPADRRAIAYHEAGHAVAARHLHHEQRPKA